MKKRFYFLPKTRLGKISFWLAVSGVLVIIILNIIAGLMARNDVCNVNGCQPALESLGASPIFIFITRIIPGLLGMVAVLTSLVTSLIAIIKYKESAILLIIPLLLGLMGVMFVLGEFLTTH